MAPWTCGARRPPTRSTGRVRSVVRPVRGRLVRGAEHTARHVGQTVTLAIVSPEATHPETPASPLSSPRMLILSQSDVAALLPMPACIDLMADVLATLDRGAALLPLRTVMRLRGGRAAAVMPAYVETPESLGVKVITVFPDNHGTVFDSHQGAVLLFEMEHGSLAAIMDASAITAIRTAAVSGVATRLLARADAGDLAILGSGVQARTHLEAMRAVRTLRRVRVWSRAASNREAFAAAAARLGIDVEPMPTARAAVEGADLVCTTTSSREPVLAGEWLAPGAHVNAVGASVPTARELDTAAVARARLVVDRRESALHEAGDFLLPLAEGAVDETHIVAELGEVVTGRARPRSADGDITVFKSLGIAVEDVAAARHVYTRALATGAGTRVELGGRR